MSTLSLPRRTVLFALTVLVVLYVILTSTSLHQHFSTVPLVRNINEHPKTGPETTTYSSANDHDALQLANNTSSSPRVLLVSALFPLSKAKHSQDEYATWLRNFLGSIDTPVYFYAPQELQDTVKSLRGQLPIYINTSYTTIFDVPPLNGLEDMYAKMHKLDREASIHNKDLYAVWNAKPFLLDAAVKHLRESKGEEYHYAFWNDAGSFRVSHDYVAWPSPQRVEEVFLEGQRLSGKRKEELLFFPLTGMYPYVKRYWREDDGPVDADISEGSFFGGSPATVSWWSNVYYAYHDHYLSKGLFVGKDQTLINALFLLFPHRIFNVWLSDPDSSKALTSGFDSGPLGACGSQWFYYQYWLANESERSAMQRKWMQWLRQDVGWPWKNWQWWLERQECRLADALWMYDTLLRKFGKGWGVAKTVV